MGLCCCRLQTLEDRYLTLNAKVSYIEDVVNIQNRDINKLYAYAECPKHCMFENRLLWIEQQINRNKMRRQKDVTCCQSEKNRERRTKSYNVSVPNDGLGSSMATASLMSSDILLAPCPTPTSLGATPPPPVPPRSHLNGVSDGGDYIDMNRGNVDGC